MNIKPKVSILIPVYNVEDYIEECLNSIVNQTFKDIEIVCVNDCSTDSSLNILQSYAEKDDRIVIVDKKQNEGLLLARKSGVEAANGEYIIFVDSDDYISLDLCQFINDITAKEDADIIHFCSGVDAETPNSRFEGMLEALKPLEKTLTGDEILDNAYIKRTYATQVWAKIYKTELCKKVYSILPDEHCYVGEDVFTTFFLSYFADKYIGIKTPQYYFYRFGLGVSGQSMITLKKFEMFAKMSNWIKFTQEYLEKNNANELQKNACSAMKERLFADCCEIYRRRVREEDKGGAEELIYEYWKDVDLKDEDWTKHIGKTKEYIKNQTSVKEYIKPAKHNDSVNISAIIYVYNNAEKMLDGIESFIEKAGDKAEFIFINDGSEDNSIDIIEEIAKTNDKITIINQKHKGVSTAYNLALKHSNGKYLHFTHANEDDFCDNLEKNSLKAEENAAEIVYCGNFEKDEITSGEKVLEWAVQNNIALSDLNNILISKEFFEKSGYSFDERISKSAEIIMPLLMASAEKVLCIKNATDKKIKYISDIKFNNTAEGYRESFMMYSTISAFNVSVKYSETTSKALSEISRKYYNISIDLFNSLSDQQAKKVNEILPIEYKPLFFSARELRNIKNSATYRLTNKLLDIPSKIFGKK